MRLNIYTDESFNEVREIRERDRMKIPYRVGQHVINTLSMLDLNNDQEVLHTLLESEKQITAVVRATFSLTDEELDYVDVMEMADLAKEIVAFVVTKMADLGLGLGTEGADPNAKMPAATT